MNKSFIKFHVLFQFKTIESCMAKKWVFPKIGVPQIGWFTMENPINPWDDLEENPLFSETSKL